MKRVIVTGANGFVGSNIVPALIERGWSVYAVDLSWDNPSVQTWDSDRVELITSTCTDLKPLSADALVHAAFITASPEARNETPESNIRANINPMLAMMEYAQANNVKRSIFLSSSGVYRSMPDTLVNENYPQTPLGVYAVAKTMMEHFVETMRTVYDRDMTCVRLGNIYGQNEYLRPSRPHLSVIGQMIDMATSTGQITVYRPDEIREWTFASDIGNAIHTLLDAQDLNHALYHVASGERQSNLSIAYLIQSLMDSVTIQIDDSDNQRPLTRLGTLDNARLLGDTGFDAWTPLHKGLMSSLAVSMLRSKADA